MNDPVTVNPARPRSTTRCAGHNEREENAAFPVEVATWMGPECGSAPAVTAVTVRPVRFGTAIDIHFTASELYQVGEGQPVMLDVVCRTRTRDTNQVKGTAGAWSAIDGVSTTLPTVFTVSSSAQTSYDNIESMSVIVNFSLADDPH